MKRQMNRKILIAVLVAAVVLGTGGVVVLTRIASNQANAAPLQNDPAKTAPVKKTNLADQQAVTGQLGYGAERALASRKSGTVTGLPKQGDVIEQGKPVFWSDAAWYAVGDIACAADTCVPAFCAKIAERYGCPW